MRLISEYVPLRGKTSNLTRFLHNILKRESNASTPNQPAVSHSSLSTPHISTPEMITEGTSSPDSLVRHSEFYKGSTSVMRRPSSESALSFIGRERGGSTLSDLVQQGNVDNDVSYFLSLLFEFRKN